MLSSQSDLNQSSVRRTRIATTNGVHTHDFAQILFGWRGKILCELDNTPMELSEGGVIVVPQNNTHFYKGLASDNELFVIDFSAQDPFLTALEVACEVPIREVMLKEVQYLPTRPVMRPILQMADSQLTAGKVDTPASSHINCQLLSLFVTQLCQYYGRSAADCRPTKRIDKRRLDTYLQSRLHDAISNRELADLFYLSESHFYALCKQQFNVTPQQYVLDQRMARAKYLLLFHPNMPLRNVSMEVGFAQQSSFSRAYKNYYQESPRQTREGKKADALASA